MEPNHRYYQLSHSADALIDAYRAAFEKFEQTKATFARSIKQGAMFSLPVAALCAFLGVAYSDDYTVGSKVAIGLSVALILFLIGAYVLGRTGLARWRKQIPLEGDLTAALLTPLVKGSPEYSRILKAADVYQSCKRHLKKVKRVNRRLYAFDASYITELVGEAEKAKTNPQPAK